MQEHMIRYVATVEAMRWLDVVRLVAIAFVWYRGSLFAAVRMRGPRLWRALHACPMCIGVWAALLGGVALVAFPHVLAVCGTAALVGALALTFNGFVAGLGPRRLAVPTEQQIRTMLDVAWIVVQGIDQFETFWKARPARPAAGCCS